MSQNREFAPNIATLANKLKIVKTKTFRLWCNYLVTRFPRSKNKQWKVHHSFHACSLHWKKLSDGGRFYRTTTASYPDVSLYNVRPKEGGKETTGFALASPAVCTLPMVPCGSSPVTPFALASAMRKTKRLRRRLGLQHVANADFMTSVCQNDRFLMLG